MTDLLVVEFGDTWVNSGRTGANYGSTNGVQMEATARRIFLLPRLRNISGRTVLDAYLVGHAKGAIAAQTVTVAQVTSRWTPGRLTWADQPTVGVTQAVVLAAAADGAAVTFPGLAARIQAVADGTDWHGLRLTTDATTAQVFHSNESGVPAWELHIVLSDAPEQPTNLRPAGGGAVGSVTPIVAWDFIDVGDDSTEQSASQVQVDKPAAGVPPDEVAPDYDSGWQTNTEPEWALAGRYAGTGAGPHFWRVKVRDADGTESAWSDWASYTFTAMPPLVVDSPTGPFGDPTPTLLASLTGGTVSHWRAYVTGPNRSDVRIRTGLRTGAVNWTVPLRNKDGRRVIREDKPGWLNLRVWPTGTRAIAVGEKPYVETWIALAFNSDQLKVAPTGLSVVQDVEGEPRLQWQWRHTEVASAYLAQVDGVTVARLEPADITIAGGVYTWLDSGHVAPLRTHELSVRAVDNNVRSNAALLSSRHVVKGVWLLPDDPAIKPFVLDGTAVGGFVRNDRRATYEPLAGPPVDIIYDWTGFSGAFEGSIDARDGEDRVWAIVDAINTLGESPVRTARMVWGSQSLTVRIVDPSVTSADDILPNNLNHVVRFGFVQVGD